ncbi:hypothetical protein DP43_6652 [Burkholderia pseudomallei]|nr:hypothetical protein DP43_6652 [Burkholderia pseudomallei]
MPEPMIVAMIGSPSRCASPRRLSTTAPTPSPGTKPSAESSKTLQRPSGDSMPDEHISMYASGDRYSVTPPASAMSISPARSAWHAKWIATSADEHAVSTGIAGPFRFR